MDFQALAKKAFSAGAKAAKERINEMGERMDCIESYKEEMDGLTDDELLRRYKRSSGDRKLACAMLLRERGHGINEIIWRTE